MNVRNVEKFIFILFVGKMLFAKMTRGIANLAKLAVNPVNGIVNL